MADRRQYAIVSRIADRWTPDGRTPRQWRLLVESPSEEVIRAFPRGRRFECSEPEAMAVQERLRAMGYTRTGHTVSSFEMYPTIRMAPAAQPATQKEKV